MLIVYPSEFLKLMFQVLTLHQHYSFSETHPLYSLFLLLLWQLNSGHLLWQRLNLETSALETLLIKTKLSCNTYHWCITTAQHSKSRPFWSPCQVENMFGNWNFSTSHQLTTNRFEKEKKKLRNLLMFGQIIKCTIAILRKIFFVTILFSKVAIHLKATFWKRELGAFQLL